MKRKLVVLGIDHGHYRKIIDAAAKRSDVELTAIAHETNDSAAKVADELGVKLYSDYKKCLDVEKPEIAGIAMFNGARGRWVLECVERGIAIIADKPLCTELAELTAIERAWSENGVPLSMMLTCRCDPRYEAMKTAVESGVIGDVLSVDAVRYYALNRLGRPDWMFKNASYGGPGLDILIHDYDLARWMTGISWDEIDLREIRTGRIDDPDFNDTAVLNSVDDGRMLNLKMLWHSPSKHWDRFTVYGTKGVIELPLTERNPVLVNSGGETSELAVSGDTQPFAERFFDALAKGDGNLQPISPTEAFAVSKNILATRVPRF